MIKDETVYNINHRCLHTIPNLRHMENIKILDASNNLIKLTMYDIQNLPPNIETLMLDNNSVTNLTHAIHLPPSLKILSLTKNEFTIFCGESLENVEELYLSGCKINRIESFPPKIKVLDISDNNIFNLPQIPTTLTHLNVSDNSIYWFPNVTHKMEELDISFNKLTQEPNEEIKKLIVNLNTNNNFFLKIIIMNQSWK